MELTSYHELLINLSSEIVNHEYGELTLEVSPTSNGKVKVIIRCGRSHVFFIDRKIKLNDNIL